jgi:membrane associated rhomboid family serine protease
MFILLPYQHDRMSVKRLPWVSIVIFALNVLAFAFTHGDALETRRREEQALEPVYEYWAANPFVKTTPAFDARYPKPVSNIRRIVGKTFEPPAPEDLARQQAQFEALIATAVAVADSGPYARFGFVPSHPTALSLLTCQFVHAGWLHLLGNLFFLYLTAPFVENIWGRIVFPIFYLAGGAVAAWTQALFFPGGTVPLVGASGAIAAVMGAFLVSLGTTQIRFFWAWMLIGVRWGTFPAPAWLMLPLWLAAQLAYANVSGGESGVAYWAHVGGFVFGAAVAGAFRISGLEARYLRPAVAEAASAYGDSRIDRGLELREAGNLPEASAQFAAVLATQPANVDARDGALVTALLMNDAAAAARHAAPALEGRLKSGNTVMAIQRYEELLRQLPQLELPARLLYALVVQQVKAYGAGAALETCSRLAAQHPGDLFTLKGLLHCAKAARAEGLGDEAQRLLAAARTHPLASGEWVAQIEKIAADSPASAARS